MDENHQDKTESKPTATEDKSTPSSLSLQDQRGVDQLQNNQIEDTIKQLRDRGYKVTEEYSNTGQLSKVSGEHSPRKTLWDWLQLLVVPLLIFFLGIGFTWVQNQTSLQIAKDNRAQDLQIARDTQEEATLKAYLDDMTTLLLDKKLGSQAVADKVASADAAVVAQAKTLTALSRLTDGRRKGRLLIFLDEAQLIGFSDGYGKLHNPIINLVGADLRHADLSGALLSYADLSIADLSGADLSYADLHHAVLIGAHLAGADLRYAHLESARLALADLRHADLRDAHLGFAHLGLAHLDGADLSGADLSGADLSYAHLGGVAGLTQQQLDQVHYCGNATLPPGLVCHRLP